MGYKRKYGKKKRGNKKLKGLTPLAVAKALNGFRQYNFEDRSQGWLSAVNEIAFTAGAAHSISADNGLANQTTILNAVGLTQLGLSSDADGVRYHISEHNVTHTLRNVTKEPCVMTCYVFKNIVDIINQDLTTDIDTLQKAFMADIVAGWDVYQTAANVNLAGTGTQVVYAQGDYFCKLLSDNLHPSNSIGLKAKWKMVKHATKRLMPGDTWVLPTHLPNIMYDPKEAQALTAFYKGAGLYTAAGSAILALANQGRIFVVRQRGEIGVSDADQSIYGWMNTNVYHGLKETARVRKVNVANGNSVYMNFAKDTDAADLMTPSQFHMVKMTDDGAIDDGGVANPP